MGYYSSYIGGLVGEHYHYGTISNSYASGKVSATGSYIGGLVGYYNSGIISNSFYDKETNSSSLMEDSSYGKTREELLSAFGGKDGWITNGSDVEGYSLDTIILPQLITLYKPTSILFNSGFGTNDNPYTITNWTQLQNINNSNILTSGYYFTLLNNIDKNSDGYMGDSGDGWLPIGDITNKFTGTFDGLNSTIFDLYINRPYENHIGLFGYTDNANINNLGLEDIEVSGYSHVSGLVGYNYYGTISNSYTIGDVSGYKYVGGLVGYNEGGTIANSYATGNVSGTDSYIGGLVGRTYSGTITNSYASGKVSGDYEVGGLVGNNENGTIENSYASGDVSGDDYVGGLVGYYINGTISNSYASGDVSGYSAIGGLVGFIYNGAIKNSYASGEVSGNWFIGGLVGYSNYGTIINSYAMGNVSGTEEVGGLVGYLGYSTIKNSYYGGTLAFVGTGDYRGGIAGYVDSSTIENSYYDKTKNPNLDDESNYGKSTNDLQSFSTFSYWDIVEDPDIAQGYPILAWQENKDKSIWLIHSISQEKPKEEPKEDDYSNIQDIISTIETNVNSSFASMQQIAPSNPMTTHAPMGGDGGASDADDPSFTAPLGGIEYLSVGLAQNVQIINGGIKLPDEPMFLDEDNN